jgi:hypothetical protein
MLVVKVAVLDLREALLGASYQVIAFLGAVQGRKTKAWKDCYGGIEVEAAELECGFSRRENHSFFRRSCFQ